jgi:hypothetical protein
MLITMYGLERGGVKGKRGESINMSFYNNYRNLLFFKWLNKDE